MLSWYTRAWLMLVLLIPSVLVTIFDLYHFLRFSSLRKALNNHVIILLLICALIESLTDIIWHIYFYFNTSVMSFTYQFCKTWAVVGPSMYVAAFTLMAWASIERHILIFSLIILVNKGQTFLVPLCTTGNMHTLASRILFCYSIDYTM
ncbi:unnamed protein product [Adineta ricciae]|uniref:G-protein coupled receptors family 1 profile domain-containing protein n=1 Tax=Adineta ricciae TaxID=249248 RepID=A0A813QR66_ADIRI|nr:unnamed protein product [Adineta ricciae]